MILLFISVAGDEWSGEQLAHLPFPRTAMMTMACVFCGR